MELIKKTICLDDLKSFNSDETWGTITATTVYFKIFLTQNIENLGMFTDTPYIPNTGQTPNYSILEEKLITNGLSFPFMSGLTLASIPTDWGYILRLTGTTLEDYFNYQNIQITATTTSNLTDVTTYSNLTPLKVGFNVNTDVYSDYLGNTIQGVDRVTNITPNAVTYVFDANANDPNIGTLTPETSGLIYNDFSGLTNNVTINGVTTTQPLSIVSYVGQGINITNSSLSAQTFQEYLFGSVFPPEVNSDVNIDRSTNSVNELLLRLSEISNLDQLVSYNNGMFNVISN